MAKVKFVEAKARATVKVPLLDIGVEGTWAPDDSERTAAWEMYVELVTRIATAELRPGEGTLREALTSLHDLFGTTRTILKTHGPSVAQIKSGGNVSFGYLAVAVLNNVLRPLLGRWHRELLAYEQLCEADVSPLEYEAKWAKADELSKELDDTRKVLIAYANVLGEVAGVQSLILDRIDQ